jgi:hypothetical protein
MEIKPPDENQLDYYYQLNYVPVVTKKVAEVNRAIGVGGHGRQSLGTKNPFKQTKGSLGINEQPTNNNPSMSKKQHKANIALGGGQSLGMKKTYTQAETFHERPVDNNLSMCNKQHKPKVALGKRAAQYLSQYGKESGTKCSLRTSPPTIFFSPC